MILPIVLLLLALLSAMTLQMQLSSRAGLKKERHASRRSRLRIAASDTAWQALRLLAADSEAVLTHTNSDWAKPLRVELPDGIIAAAIIRDAGRSFNINNLGVAALTSSTARLPHMIVADLLAEAGCEEPGKTALSMQTEFGKRPAGAPGSLLQGYADLAALAPDADPEQLADLFSVLPNAGLTPTPVNVNTAPEITLRAILGDSQAFEAAALVRRRDVQPLAALEHFSGFPAISNSAPYLDVRGMFFEVDARAEQGEMQAGVWVLAERDPQAQWRILRWVCR